MEMNDICAMLKPDVQILLSNNTHSNYEYLIT